MSGVYCNNCNELCSEAFVSTKFTDKACTIFYGV